MTMLRPRGAALGLLALFSVTVACGARGPIAPSPPAATITLTDAGCTADGFGALLPEHFVVTIFNKTSSLANFNVQRLQAGHAYREMELHYAEQQQRLATGMPFQGPPAFTDILAVTSVDSVQSDAFEATLTSGIYGLVCRRYSRALVVEAVFLIGPFRVP